MVSKKEIDSLVRYAAQEALIECVELQYVLRIETIKRLIKDIKQRDLQFGRHPFDTMPNSKRYFAEIFGLGESESDPSVENVATEILTSSEKYQRELVAGQEALITWMRGQDDLDKETLDRLIKDIKQRELHFGAHPFDTIPNAKTFLAEILGLGESDSIVEGVATEGFIRSEQFRSMLVGLYIYH